MYGDGPVLAICGFSGSGKTTLIEAVLPLLAARGWRVAVVKHDAHGLQIDKPGKDSDRLFRAGADMIVHGPEEFLLRGRKGRLFDLTEVLAACRNHYDLVLIEGHKDTPLAKVWLDSDDESAVVPSGVENILVRFSRGQDRVDALLKLLDQWLPQQFQKTPVYGCILIGGKSRRMGQPKHLLKTTKGISWVEHQVALLADKIERVVIAGAGKLPPSLSNIERLIDVPDVPGPMAGMLAAMRWQPGVSWLMVACDMPNIKPEAIDWLLARRRPGMTAVQPCLKEGGPVEPLLACYEIQALAVIETMARQAEFSPSRLASYCSVLNPVVPDELMSCWGNINTEKELFSSN